MTYPSSLLTALCVELLDDHGLTPEQIAALAADIPGECAAIRENRAEQAWQERTEIDNSGYRATMRAAGRGNLLGG